MAKIIENFNPTQAQKNELLATLKNVFSNVLPPKQIINQDNTYADINAIRPITELTDKQRMNYQPDANEQIEAGKIVDPVLRNKSEEEIQNALANGQNLGSKTLDNIEHQQTVDDLKNKLIQGQMTGGAEPVSEKKQLLDNLIKQELEKLQQPVATSSSDIVPAFQKEGFGAGMQKLANYLGTAEGQNVMSSLMGAFGNKNMQIAYNRQAGRQRDIEETARQEQERAKRELLDRYISGTSAKGSGSFKNVIDTYHAMGQVSDDDYAKLQQSSDYLNDAYYPTSTLNKFLEPYLIATRGKQAINLQGIKTADDLKKMAAQFGYDIKKIGETAQQGAAKEKDVAEFKEKLPSVETETKKKEKELENLGGTSPKATVQSIQKQIDNFTGTFNVMPAKKAMAGTAARQVTGTQTPAETNFSSQRTLLFNRIARDLGGEKGVLSDQDIKRIEQSLPTLYDSKAQKEAKMKAVQDLIDIRMQQYGGANAQTQTKINKRAF